MNEHPLRQRVLDAMQKRKELHGFTYSKPGIDAMINSVLDALTEPSAIMLEVLESHILTHGMGDAGWSKDAFVAAIDVARGAE